MRSVVSYLHMSNTTRSWIVGVVVVLVILGIAWWYTRTPNLFPVSASDNLTSWTIPVNVDATSTAAFKAQIATLKSYVGTTTYPTSDIYIGIANEYGLLGDGKSAYQYYLKALNASSTEAVTYDNLGALFARLYATTTATRAYAKAIALDPSEALFQISYLNYLTQVAPQDAMTATAFADAKTALGSTTPDFLITEATWLGAIGSTTAAIADWRKLEAIEPGNAAAIEARIAALRKQ